MLAYIQTAIAFVRTAVAFIQARLREPSTYTAFALAAAAGSALSPPWSYLGAFAAFMAAMIPDKQVK